MVTAEGAQEPLISRQTWLYVGLAIVAFVPVGFSQVYEIVFEADGTWAVRHPWLSPLAQLLTSLLGTVLIWWSSAGHRRHPLVAAGLVIGVAAEVLHLGSVVAALAGDGYPSFAS